LVFFATKAAFSTTTETHGSLSSGKIELTDNDSNSAIFALTDMRGGQSESRCVKVEYGGTTVPVDVKLYTKYKDETEKSLGAFLDVKVEQGTYTEGSANATGTANPAVESSCDGFVPSGTVAGTGGAGQTFATFSAAHSDFATAAPTWSPKAQHESKVFKITLRVQDNNEAQGKAATPVFVWEVRH
jgi:hypothetical protein